MGIDFTPLLWAGIVVGVVIGIVLTILVAFVFLFVPQHLAIGWS